MRGLVVIATAFWVALVAAGPTRAQVAPDIGERLAETYIRPATLHFANAAAGLAGAMDYYCRAPDDQREVVVRERFANLADAWFRILFLRFGPLVEDNRFERIFLWPDPRGVTLRQVQEILASMDPTAVDADRLREKSAAVQGLPAFEFALFGTGAEEIKAGTREGRYRCAYGLAVSRRLMETAAEIEEAWSPASPFARDFTEPSAQNRVYRSSQEVAAEATKALATGFTFLADAVIAPFLGKEPEQANSKRAPLWRSGLTIQAIGQAVAGLEAFYDATGFEAALKPGDRWIDGSLRLEMGTTAQALGKVDTGLEEAVASGRGREALVYAVIALKSLHTTVETRLAPAVGVSVGFNALDGD